jgi:hypothetical protein
MVYKPSFSTIEIFDRDIEITDVGFEGLSGDYEHYSLLGCDSVYSGII